MGKSIISIRTVANVFHRPLKTIVQETELILFANCWACLLQWQNSVAIKKTCILMQNMSKYI